jgi:regulatory protein
MDRWEVPFPAQQRILARLREEGFLDEARYCRAYVNDKTRIAKWGRNKILYALRQKQISADDIQSAFRDIETADVAEQLAEILRQKRKTVKGRDEYEIRAKLIRFALGRGFDMDDILKQI